MHYYNTKIIDFNGSVEVRHYKSPIGLLDDSEKEERREKRSMKKIPDLEVNPFTGSLEEFNPWVDDDLKEILDNRSVINSLNRTKQAVYSICRSNSWEWFITLTFDPEKIDSTDYDICVRSLHDWLKYIRKNYAPDLKYILVPELHKDGMKYHFHGLFSNIGSLRFIYSGIIKNGVMIYNLKQYKKGFCTASLVQNTYKASAYIVKYITKDLCSVSKGRKRYWHSNNLDKPDIILDNLSVEDVGALLDSFGELSYAKTLVQVYSDIVSDSIVAYNRCNIYQVSSK